MTTLLFCQQLYMRHAGCWRDARGPGRGAVNPPFHADIVSTGENSLIQAFNRSQATKTNRSALVGPKEAYRCPFISPTPRKS